MNPGAGPRNALRCEAFYPRVVRPILVLKPRPAVRHDVEVDFHTNDGIVNFADLGALKRVFLTNDANADFDGSGLVNSIDLGIMKTFFFQPPGPSGIVASE